MSRVGLGAWTMVGREEGAGESDNGLPLTPSSVQILARFRALHPRLIHPALLPALEIHRGAHDRVFVVEEYREKSLCDWISSPDRTVDSVLDVGWQVASGLAFLHHRRWRHGSGVVHRNLTLGSVRICGETETKSPIVRLSQYAAYAITNSARLVHTSIGEDFTLPPEVFVEGAGGGGRCGPKADSWALGVLLFQLALGVDLGRKWTPQQAHGIYASLVLNSEPLECGKRGRVEDAGGGGSILPGLLAAAESEDTGAQDSDLLHTSEELRNLIEACLQVDLKSRPTCSDILSTIRKPPLISHEDDDCQNLDNIFVCHKRCKDISIEKYQAKRERIMNGEVECTWEGRPLEEVYFLWKLAGPSVETIMIKAGLLKTKPPITTMPDLLKADGSTLGREEERQQLVELSLIPLSLANLRSRLEGVDVDTLCPTALTPQHHVPPSPLPTLVKERDIRYQLDRMVRFRGLLAGHPYQSARLWQEARLDIPPLYRGHVWSALLGVTPGLVRRCAEELDVVSVTSTDRQIEVDAPRCHQYDPLMSSPEAQKSLKDLLKAWVNSHPQYVYWQGLDSLSAPFLHLHYANPPLAYASLSAFVPRYLHDFFKYDNSAIIQEYLAVFNHLIAFHDPELASHLKHIDFFPELYAIPWFLTMFAHVFPLDKLYHLWDTLLLGDSAFPLCVGVAILHQLRPLLLTQGFNESILLFSDLPEIDIERCVRDSVRFFCVTPKSVCYRSHAPPCEAPAAQATRPLRHGTFTDDHDPDHVSDAQLTGVLEERSGMTVSELKSETVPRLSAAELLRLTAEKRTPVLVVDARPTEEFLKGTFPGSVSIPWEVGATLETMQPDLSRIYEAQKRKSIVVVLHRNQNIAISFTSMLVDKKVGRVCVLHNGVSVLRKANVLTVPPPNIQ